MVPELKALGIKRVRVDNCEIEFPDQLSVVDLNEALSAPEEPRDPTKCEQCQVRPKGRLVKGLCRECALGAAGVSLD